MRVYQFRHIRGRRASLAIRRARTRAAEGFGSQAHAPDSANSGAGSSSCPGASSTGAFARLGKRASSTPSRISLASSGLSPRKFLGVLASLSQPDLAVGVPRAGLIDDLVLDGHIEQVAGDRDPLVEHDVELRLLERGRDLVLDDADARAVAHALLADLDGPGPPDVEAHGRVELERPPALVVSGEPNMTPIFSRIWLMKMTVQLDRAMTPVSLRIAWDMRRAWSPTTESPISPSISARGISAATESTTITSTALERTRSSQISRACSPVSGWDTSMSSMLTPILRAQDGSSACSASMNAATPSAFCACARRSARGSSYPRTRGRRSRRCARAGCPCRPAPDRARARRSRSRGCCCTPPRRDA